MLMQPKLTLKTPHLQFVERERLSYYNKKDISTLNQDVFALLLLMVQTNLRLDYLISKPEPY